MRVCGGIARHRPLSSGAVDAGRFSWPKPRPEPPLQSDHVATPMHDALRLAAFLGAAALTGACVQQRWPEPPPIDRTVYDAEYNQWLEGQRETAVEALEIIGVWSLDNGDTAFGGDPALPIAIPHPSAPQRAGVFRRRGDDVTIVPEPGAGLRMADGPAIGASRLIDGTIAMGSLRFLIDAIGHGSEGRRFVTVWDEAHPVALGLAKVATFPVDLRWRVAARFDALDAPITIRVPDVRGGTIELVTVGKLVMRLEGRERRLTAIANPDDEQFFVMFRDDTNGSTTYGGYRVLYVPRVAPAQWTVVDFNKAGNPPCAYSPFTLCPLPPRENRLDLPIEAGERLFVSERDGV